MRLRLASRKSDLARWQAVQVARALEQLPSRPSIEFLFKSSLGDQNLDLPLAGMGAKGVFTEDFYADLVNGQCDLVVHSWKDLPVEERSDTHIALTLKRADPRDVLLVPEKVWQNALETGRLEILTSSPRRVYNLSFCLPKLLPGNLQIDFVNVRGNVPTRLSKMHEQGRALVLAKAGLDRLLFAEREGFIPAESVVRGHVEGCRFQILPLSVNPPAPAQGALAVEIANSNEAVKGLCKELMDESSFHSVQKERAILRKYGGGCHQKIGVAVLPREYGVIHALRGLTDQGQVLNEWKIESEVQWSRAISAETVFPLEAKANSWFHREPISCDPAGLAASEGLFVARADAFPEGYSVRGDQKVWTAGVQTWIKLAQQGVWVNGCQDGLGEKEPLEIESVLGRSIMWTKLTHAEGHESSFQSVATYRLVPKRESDVPNLNGKTHFFWMSRSSFERAYALFPEPIKSGHNACGPGVTYDFLKRQTRLQKDVKVFAGLEQFLQNTLPLK